MKKLLIDTYAHFRKTNATRMGAALSYYAMLSFIPLLLLVITVVSYLFSKDLVEGAVVSGLAHKVGSGAASYVDELIRNRGFENVNLLTALIGVAVALTGAIGVFSELDQDFDILWGDAPTKRRVSWLSKFLTQKIVALSFIPLIVILLLVSLGSSAVLDVIKTKLPEVLIQLMQIGIQFVLGVLLCMVCFRVLPNRKLPMRVIALGSLITNLMLLIGNFLVLMYIRLLVNTDVFGGAASLVGMLVWIYYSAQVFFLGASFTYIYAKDKNIIRVRD